MKNRIQSRFVAGLLLLTFCCVAQAYMCRGSVDRIVIRGHNGGLAISSASMFGHGPSDGIDICSVKDEWKGISTQVCFAWLSMLQKSKENGSIVSVQYQTDGKTCQSQAAWSNAPAPYAIFQEP